MVTKGSLRAGSRVRPYRANGLTKHDEFYFGTLAREYDALGITGQPLVMSQTTYKKSKSEKHNVPQRVFNNLESIMRQPILSFEIGNSVGVLTDEIDGDGKPLLVGVLKDAELDGETVTRIKSIYGLDNPKEWIANQIREGKELRIYDDKKADSFLNGFGYKAGRAENYRLGDIVQSVEENVKGNFHPPQRRRKTTRRRRLAASRRCSSSGYRRRRGMQTRKQTRQKSRTGAALIPSGDPRHLPLVTKGRLRRRERSRRCTATTSCRGRRGRLWIRR